MFFTRFNNIFPIIHAPTFQPSAKNALLVLSICSAGSLFIGSSKAVYEGSRLFERVNKAILSSVILKFPQSLHVPDKICSHGKRLSAALPMGF